MPLLVSNRLNQHLKQEIFDKLQKECGNDNICTQNERPQSSFGIGGAADIILRPDDEQELLISLQVINSFNEDIPILTLGSGSNILISDCGVRGIIIHLGQGFKKIELEGLTADVGAAAILAKLTNESGHTGLSGLESTYGIPGTVGGALVMNAGTDRGSIGDLVEEITVIKRNGERLVHKKDCLVYEYRKSQFTGNTDAILIGAKFGLTEGKAEDIMYKMNELRELRHSRQPYGCNTAGSTFKNFHGKAAQDLIKRDKSLRGSHHTTKDVVAAGKLIDIVECKNLSVGKARVSDLHANFIIAEKGASAQDILDLINIIKTRVYDKFEHELELEIKLVGF